MKKIEVRARYAGKVLAEWTGPSSDSWGSGTQSIHELALLLKALPDIRLDMPIMPSPSEFADAIAAKVSETDFSAGWQRNVLKQGLEALRTADAKFFKAQFAEPVAA